MKTICILTTVALIFGCSTSTPPLTISGVEAAEHAWAAMEDVPSDSETISQLMETKKLMVEQVESAGRHLWRVTRSDAVMLGGLVPVANSDRNMAIAAAPETLWVVWIDITNGDIVSKHRPTTR